VLECFVDLGLGDSMADIRQLYQAKQAAGKVKRITYDETKHRDEVDTSSQIRSYPMVESTPSERQLQDSPKSVAMKLTSSTSVTKKSR
jgi:predicted transcriptional regulator